MVNLKRKYNYTYEDIENSLQRKSWWAVLLILPFARRISYYIINYTDIRPNTITISSFAFVLFSAVCFSKGSYIYLILGALFFEINYLFDCVDGTVARVKKFDSTVGAFLDWKLDRLRIILITMAIGYGQYKTEQNILPLLLSLLYLGMNNFIIFTRAFQARILKRLNINESNLTGVSLVRNTANNPAIEKWLKFTYDKNIMPYYHDIETDAVAFVIGPVTNSISICLIIASSMALFLVLTLDILFFKNLRKCQKI